MEKKFNSVFLYGDFDKIDVPFVKKINSLRDKFEKIILGIFSDDIEWRIKRSKPIYSFEERKQLNAVGADIVYLPYTERVSTTMLRSKLRDR